MSLKWIKTAEGYGSKCCRATIRKHTGQETYSTRTRVRSRRYTTWELIVDGTRVHPEFESLRDAKDVAERRTA